METAFLIIATALPLWLAVYGFYWWFMRPALAAKVRLTITNIESETIELLVCAGQPDRRDPLRVVLERCQRAKRNVDKLTISRVLLTEPSRDTEADFKREQLVLVGAAADIQKLDTALTYRLFFAVLINSPMFATIGIALASMAEIFGAIRRAYTVVMDRTWEATVDERTRAPASA